MSVSFSNPTLNLQAGKESDGLSVSEILERANANLVRSDDGPILTELDIAIDSEAERNADPCTSRGCMWLKNSDGKVYVPYYITDNFSSREKAIITRGLESFSSISCIRFRPTFSNDHEWLQIESQNGCWSYVGRRGGKQVLSLARSGCLYHHNRPARAAPRSGFTTSRPAPTETSTSESCCRTSCMAWSTTSTRLPP
ncbi:hypothetical protein KUCAC02_020407 [Chaenocephalus aceratus]|nr:hypothetical protein KUCAC02_020407 [Chaenocephalus aceratus]